MKRFLLFIGLLLTFSNLSAQKNILKTFKSSNLEHVFVHLQFANDIVIKNWDKDEVAIEAEVNMNENKDNEHFSLQSDKIGNSLTVKSDYGTFFKERQNYYRKKNGNGSCNNIVVNYVIHVPKKIQLKVKSISGNVEAITFTGNLILDLISGNINIKKHSKNMYLKTISGDIDIYVSDATFDAKTLTGGVYSDLDIDFNNGNKISHGGQKVSGRVKKGNAYLKLETISGDIFLRKF